MTDLSNFKFNKEKKYEDGKYTVYNISTDFGEHRRITCESDSICIIPFDVNDQNQIKNVYLIKYHDYLDNKSGFSCITTDIKEEEDRSYFETVLHMLEKELGLTEIDVNDLFYLGKIQHTLPFSKNYRCYAINLTNNQTDPNGFTPKLSDEEMKKKLNSIEKVRFTRILKGEVPDSLTLSSSVLLLSYFQ